MNWLLLQNSLLVAGTTTVLAVSFGLLVALWLATLEMRGRMIFLTLAVIALALPPFLVTNCWIDLLGETGALRAWLPFKIYSLGGTIWILSLMLWPSTLLAVLSGWQRLEAAQFECEPAMADFALLRWLLIPVAKGELALAAVLTFVLALNNFAVPAILQTKVLPDEMWVRFNTQFDAMGALTLGIPLMIAPVILLAWTSRRDVRWPRMQGTVSARIFRRQFSASWHIGCGMLALMLTALSVGLPLLQIAMTNRTWSELAGAVEAGTGAIWNSFWFAVVAATLAMGLALVVTSRTHVRTDGAARRPYLGIVAWLPFFIPGVLLGIALIKVFNRPVIAAFYQSAGIVVLAFVIRYFAVGWTATRHAIGSVDSDLTDAAKLEGATRWQLLRHVHWPQIAPQMYAAWYVIYLLCLWDVESMVLVVPPGGETLALRIFNLLHYGHNAQVNALCLTLLALAVMPLAVGGAYVALRAVWLRRDTSIMLAGVFAMGLAGCSPQSPSNEALINSQFFERVQIIGTRGTGVGQFNKPRSVAVDKQDNLYVVDMTGRVQKFSPEGEFILSWQMPQTDLGKPKGMGCDRDGNIIVIEPHYQRVNHFTPEGKLVAQWGTHGTNDGQLTLPRSAAVNSRGEIFVSEYTVVDRVQRFKLPTTKPTFNIQHSTSNVERSPLALTRSTSAEERENTSPTQAEWLGSFGQPGNRDGEFNRAEGLGIDVADRVYVADSCNHRIQVFSPEGKWLRNYGKAGSGKGELSYPYDVRVDAKGMQFVCEFGNSRVQIFDALDRPVEMLGKSGFAPGQFSTPWAIALDTHGNLYVADAGNHRVQKFVRRENVAADVRRRFGVLGTAMPQEKSDNCLMLVTTKSK